MKAYTFAILLAVTGCSSTSVVSEELGTRVIKEEVVIKEDNTPQLWTGQKELTESVEVCAFKAESILSSLGFSKITKSVYESQTYIYANFVNNRAGLHCTSVGGKTFVYGAIAGPDVKTVETLRNNIFWKF